MFWCFELNRQTVCTSYNSLQHWNSKHTPDKCELLSATCVPEDGSIHATCLCLYRYYVELKKWAQPYLVREWQSQGLTVILTYSVENLYAKWRHWLQADPPDVQKIPVADALGVTVVLLTCSYRQQEFVRVGYFINNEYTEPELRENPPAQPQFDKVSIKYMFRHTRYKWCLRDIFERFVSFGK